MATRSHTSIGLIDNTGPNKLLPYLRATGSSCGQIDIAVAFITAAGVESLLHLLQRVARKGRVRILTGLYQGFTDPRALASLMREQVATNGRLAVRIYEDNRFHWKSYFLIAPRRATAIIGSSNMTSEGLGESGELNVVLSSRPDAKDFRSLHAVFERHWTNKSVALTEQILEVYGAWHRKQEPSRRRAVPMKAILGRKQAPKETSSDHRERSYWQLSCVGTMAQATEDLLNDITNWDKQRLETLSTFTSLIRNGDRAVLFDHNSHRLLLVDIEGDTRSPSKTPDGRNFIGYRVKRSTVRKRFGPTLWKQLREMKLVKSKHEAQFIRRISEKKYKAFEEMLTKR